MTNPLAIIQARMSSRRLPGKMLRTVQGRPMLAFVVDRLRLSREIAGIVVATSIAAEDDAIAAACVSLDVECHRGPLDNVVGRFLEVVETRTVPAVVRISGDSPLIDPAIVDQAVRLFVERSCDLVSNVAPRSFPRGESVEVIAAAALRRAASGNLTAAEREHVTLWFYRHPEACSIVNFAAPCDMSKLQLSVDTAEDFAAFAATIAAMTRPHWEYGLGEIIALRRQVTAVIAASG